MSGVINQVGSKSGIVGSDVYPAGHVINHRHYTNPTRRTSNAASNGDFWVETYTKLLAGTKLIVTVRVPLHEGGNGTSGEYITIGGTQYASIAYSYGSMSAWASGTETMAGTAEKTGQAAGSVSIGWGVDTGAGGNLCGVINPNSTDEARNNQKVSIIDVWEIMT